MSSDRSGEPADVVPGDESPSGAESTGRRSRRRREKPESSLLRELPVLLLVAFVLALVVKTFFAQAFFIPSGSMEQTLHGCPGCTGDRVLVNKVPYWFGEPEPGDIVVFQGPDTWVPEVEVQEPANWFTGALLWLGRTVGVAPPSEDDYVKRVIATGGQTVECCDAEGRVTVDGQPLDEPYLYENTPLESRGFDAVTVPEGRLWVMGDHRSASADSRSHVGDRYSGTIAVDDVIGKAALIVWPVNRFGTLDDPDIQGVEASAAPPSGSAGPASPVGPVLPPGAGLVGALPVTVWHHRRRSRRVARRGPG
ncbi:signal peptidase I [Geodermatophilus maliterrae]|uniref:Signal peptidase I n=1 Tax=Geodermatophilus maliterrae TaxID=3162531 RepID=A0ABV3XHK4_9ACTN